MVPGSPQVKRLILIDGNALLHRAYHATPPLSTSNGELVNAVYGFSSMLLKALDELKPEYLAVTWDLKAKTFRHAAFANYKAKRKPMEEGLSSQFERAHQILEALNIPQFSLAGFEADDLIGTLAMQAKPDLEVIIVTGDRDLMQLINSRIKIFMPKKTLADVGMYGEEEFALKYGFAPKNLVDYKALAGDQSDGIIGVPKIGEISATKLIQEYQTIRNIYQNLKNLPEKLQKLLIAGKESCMLSQKLATIDTNVPIKLDLQACVVHDFERNQVIKLFEELEFRSLIKRIPEIARDSTGASVGSPSHLLANASVLRSPMATSDTLASGSSRARGIREQPPSVFNILNDTAKLDTQVLPILEEMSKTGVLVDLVFLSRLSMDLHTKLDHIEEDLYSIIGHQCNLNSPKQLQVVLFDELKLPVIKKTKTGRSTDEETLLELKTAHPVVALLLQYRTLYKLVSTYVDALPKTVGADGRVHSTFNVEGAATGRITSQEPNLQNIPVGGETGSEIRRAFIAPKGKILLAADYSQIELRILADLSHDENLIKAFTENQDIHSLTAAKIFNVAVGQITKEQRMVGKTMNFATLYGQGPHALSRQLGVEYKVALQYIEEYFAQFPKVRAWKEKVLEGAREKGYSETLWGRKRYVPELMAGNKMMQSFGERAAINHPVQGTAADMIKKAMVNINRAMGQVLSIKGEECKMILQVHDELLFECNDNSVEEVAKMVKEKMENALKLSVPVLVDLKVGPNWGEMKYLEI